MFPSYQHVPFPSLAIKMFNVVSVYHQLPLLVDNETMRADTTSDYPHYFLGKPFIADYSFYAVEFLLSQCCYWCFWFYTLVVAPAAINCEVFNTSWTLFQLTALVLISHVCLSLTWCSGATARSSETHCWSILSVFSPLLSPHLCICFCAFEVHRLTLPGVFLIQIYGKQQYHKHYVRSN